MHKAIIFIFGFLLLSISFFSIGKAQWQPPWIINTPTGPTSGLQIVQLIENITNWFFIGFMLLAVVFVVLGAWQFIASGGNPDSVGKARKKLLWVIIAVVIALMARGIPVVVASLLGVGGGGGGGLPPPPVPAPIAHWNFDQGSGTTISDVVGSNTGTLNLGIGGNTSVSAAWVAGAGGIPGTALEFDNIDDYVEVPNAGGVFDLTDATGWTVAACVAPYNAGIFFVSDPIIWKIANNGLNQDVFALGWGTGDVFRTKLEEAGVVDFGISSNAHAPVNWYHVVGTYDGNEISIYVNGAKEGGSTIGPATALTGPAPLRIGNILNSNHGGAGVLDGRIDDVKIWNAALSSAQVASEDTALGCSSAPPPL